MTKFLFIRHGETDLNKQHRTIGQAFHVSLNNRGVEQAEEVTDKLSKDIDLFFASPQKRASQTAEIINKKLNLDLEFRDELKERDYGSLSGHTWEEIVKISSIDNIHELDKTLQYDYRPFGGESVEDVKFRFLRLVNELKEKYPDKKILIVTHGGLMRIMHAVYSQKEGALIGNATIHEFDL